MLKLDSYNELPYQQLYNKNDDIFSKRRRLMKY